jgi:hypothetical protein
MDIIRNISIYDINDFDKIKNIPIASHISYLDNDNQFINGGYLLAINKKYFKVILDLSCPDQISKIKYSDISKLYIVINRKTYFSQYKKVNRDKIQKWNKDYYERKKIKIY